MDIESWIEAARADSVEYKRRQAAHVLIWGISYSDVLNKQLYLKGGMLMNLLYGSPRMTQDVDFTTTMPQEGFEISFREAINKQMAVAAADLGYIKQRFQVQSMELRPKKAFPWPTLRVKIGFAEKGTLQEQRIHEGMASTVLKVDISFNEKVHDWQEVVIADREQNIVLLAYSIYQQIAEKLRAILQQGKSERDRYRRQDIFDIARIVSSRVFDEKEKLKILDLFMQKALERGISPTREMIDNQELYDRANRRYAELKMDSGNVKLDFGRDFEITKQFYFSLPWR